MGFFKREALINLLLPFLIIIIGIGLLLIVLYLKK